MTKKPRVYKKGEPGSEYDAYHGKPEQKKRRAERNAARRSAEKSGAVQKGDSKEVHHTNASRLGSLSKTPTKVVSKKTNRSIQPKRK